MTKERSPECFCLSWPAAAALPRWERHVEDHKYNSGMLFSSEARWRSSEGDRSLGISGYVVMIQIDVANQGEGDSRDITSPEVSP